MHVGTASQEFAFLFHGSAFLTLGVAVGARSLQFSGAPFAIPFRYLALFGLTHSLHEFLELISRQGAQPSWTLGVHLFLMGLSFFLLLGFALHLRALTAPEKTRTALIFPTAAATVWLILLAVVLLFSPGWLTPYTLATRLVIALPAMALSTWVLLFPGQPLFPEPQVSLSLHRAGLAFAAYLALGLFAVESGPLPDETLFLSWTGQPIQLFRGLAALAIAWHMVTALDRIGDSVQSRIHQETSLQNLALRHANRALKALSACHQAIREAGEANLFLARVCRILVETGNYGLACISFHNPDDNGIRVLSARYPDHGDCPSCQILRDPQPSSSAVPAFFPSAVAIPLYVAGSAAGVIHIHTGEENAFDDESLDLLRELSQVVSHGVMFLQSKKELQDREITLAAVRHMARFGYWEWYLERQECFWSEEVFTLFEWSREEGNPTFPAMLDRIHPEDREIFQRRLQSILREPDATLDMIFRLLPEKHRPQRHLHSVCQVARNARGHPQRVVGALADVTRHVVLKQALIRQASLLDSILRSSLDVAIAATDLDMTILYYNPVAEKIFGYTAQEVIGRTVIEIHLQEKVAPERLERAIAQVRATGSYEYEVTHERQGETRIVSSRVSGIWNPERELIGFVLISRDVTEERRADEELRRHRDHLDRMVRERTQDLVAAYLKLEERQEELRKYSAIVSTSQDLMALLDTRLHYLAVNASYETVMGKPRDEIIGHSVEEVLGRARFQELQPRLEDCLAGGEIRFGTWFHAPAGMGPIWMNVRYSPYRDDAGAVRGIVVLIRDDTRLRLSQEALEESEQRFRWLFDAMSSGVAVYQAVDEGRDFVFKDFNQAGQRVSRASLEEVRGRRVTEVFPGIEKMGLLELFRQVFQDGLPRTLPQTLYQDNRLSQWVENRVYRLPNGEVVAIYEDRSEEKTREQTIRDLAKFPDQNPFPVLRVGGDGVLLYANLGAIPLLDHWRRQIGETIPEEPWRHFSEALATGERKRLEITLRERRFALEIVPFPDSGYLNLYGMDITDLQRLLDLVNLRQREVEALNVGLEKRIRDAVAENREKDLLMAHQARRAAMGEMIGHIAHQWRQPISLLGLILANLEDMMPPHIEDSARPKIEKGFALIQQMSQTIDDFRDFFRPGKEAEAFLVQREVERVVSLLDASFTNHGLRIALSASKEEVWAWGYPNEFAHVLLVLINNARDAMLEHPSPEGGEVAIAFSFSGEWSVVTVADEGGGIPGEILGRIFDPYFTTKDPARGTGLGLYMAKKIVEGNMGGLIEVRNQGKGASFSIYLPRWNGA